ncbi:MAG TPA: histidine kinase [Solirubrobacteraceae bacterium]|nr:histidine kinase [Solirubrobacteraceae bacterium]
MARRRTGLAAILAGALIGGGTGLIGAHDALPPLVGAALGAGLALAPRLPEVACLLAWVALGVASATLHDLPFSVYCLAAAHAFAVARYAKRSRAIVGLAGLMANGLVAVARTHDSAVPIVLVLGTAWLAGQALRERALLAERLATRARELQSERDAYARLSVRYERARIASELHDIVAHAISVMVVQATAGQRLVGHSPEMTEEALAAISQAARDAKDDMGRLVALLADGDAPGGRHDLQLVQELVGRAAGSGLDVTLRVEGDPDGLADVTLDAIYRVVQESLTNALRYAAGATVHVVLGGDAVSAFVDVANGPAPNDEALAGFGTGNGLRGLRERVAECGGSLEAGPAQDGGWRVRAVLPRRVASSLLPGSG